MQFKAFPNLDRLKTSTVWQQDEHSAFNYRAQFPVLMTPDNLEKMEKFFFVFELWDQVSPSVQDFLGLVKVPLAPLTYSMRTTDEEVFSLNFMADQFCMYPMTVSDGYLPIYSPKLGQNIGHLKLTVAMGSPVQVNRLIQKEEEEEARRRAELQRVKIIEAERLKETQMKEERRKKKEIKRQREEEERKRKEEEEERNGLASLLGGGRGVSPMKAGGGGVPKNIEKLLRQSLNSQATDYDQRDRSMLNSMRKLFEEARAHDIDELNGEAFYKDDVKNFDGTV